MLLAKLVGGPHRSVLSLKTHALHFWIDLPLPDTTNFTRDVPALPVWVISSISADVNLL